MEDQVLKNNLINDDDDVLVYIDPAKRASVTIALLIGFFSIHFFMRANGMCTAYIIADWNAGDMYSAGKALQTAVMVVATAVSAKLIPELGIRKVMLFALAVCAITNALTCVVPNLALYLVVVMLQGVGNATLISNMIALMNKIWPPSKRAMWMSTIGITQGIAAVAIPTLCGIIIDKMGWRWVYIIMIVLQVISMILVVIVVPKNTKERNYVKTPYDLKGTLLFLVWICCCVLAMNFANAWGWSNPKIIGLLVVTVISLVIWLVVENRAGRKAVFPVRLFKENFNMTCIFMASFIGCVICMGGQFVFLIYYMQVIMGTTATISSIPFTIFSIGTTLMPIVYSAYYKKTGKIKGVFALCMLFLTINTALYGFILTPTTSLPIIYLISAIGGLGHAAVVTVCYNACDQYLPKSRTAEGVSVAYIAICIAGSVGMAVLQAIVNGITASKIAAGVEEMAARAVAYQTEMLIAGAIGVVGIIFVLLLSMDRKNNGAYEEEVA